MRERAYPICNFIQVNKNVKNVTNFFKKKSQNLQLS